MKKLSYFLLMIIAVSGCKKEKTTDIKPVDINVKVSYDLQSSQYSLPLDEVSIRLREVNTGSTIETKTNAQGEILFDDVASGVYDIDATKTLTAAQYTTLTGIQTTSSVTFNASSKNTQIRVGFTGSIDLKLVAGRISDWVIKQIYFAGSDTKSGALYRDQFIEFYNNSDKTLYADSLYFAEITGLISSPNTYNLLATGQLDWSKSANMPATVAANTEYVYSRAILMIPGTGKQYPVQPGKSIVVAQGAINHKSPFTGADGKTVSVLDPSLTIDLSSADFEGYYGNLPGINLLATDVDTGVPNLEVIQYFGRDMIFDTNGKYSYVIFKTNASIKIKDLPQYNYPTKATPTSTAAKYFQIPNQLILDAVEIQPNVAADRVAKKLSPSFDAGFAFVPLGSYTSQSVIRKTSETVNGRIVLKDTNNSTEDFDYLSPANPRGFK